MYIRRSSIQWPVSHNEPTRFQKRIKRTLTGIADQLSLTQQWPQKRKCKRGVLRQNRIASTQQLHSTAEGPDAHRVVVTFACNPLKLLEPGLQVAPHKLGRHCIRGHCHPHRTSGDRTGIYPNLPIEITPNCKNPVPFAPHVFEILVFAAERRRNVATSRAQRNSWKSMNIDRVPEGRRSPPPRPGRKMGHSETTSCASLHSWLHPAAPAGQRERDSDDRFTTEQRLARNAAIPSSAWRVKSAIGPLIGGASITVRPLPLPELFYRPFPALLLSARWL